jgi:hypothetical protein
MVPIPYRLDRIFSRGGCEMISLTQERLKELLHYDPETGVFTWIGTKARRICNGDEAGSIRKPNSSGLAYRLININYNPEYAHRLAWLYMTGNIPEDQIDHKDGDGTNNRWANLRPCSDGQNKRNTRKPKTNKSGFKGVAFHSQRQKWRAYISINGRQIHLGLFDTPSEAYAARCRSAADVHGEFARAA